eukprot:3082142-Rhodomonas_salina.1
MPAVYLSPHLITAADGSRHHLTTTMQLHQNNNGDDEEDGMDYGGYVATEMQDYLSAHQNNDRYVATEMQDYLSAHQNDDNGEEGEENGNDFGRIVERRHDDDDDDDDDNSLSEYMAEWPTPPTLTSARPPPTLTARPPQTLIAAAPAPPAPLHRQPAYEDVVHTTVRRTIQRHLGESRELITTVLKDSNAAVGHLSWLLHQATTMKRYRGIIEMAILCHDTTTPVDEQVSAAYLDNNKPAVFHPEVHERILAMTNRQNGVLQCAANAQLNSNMERLQQQRNWYRRQERSTKSHQHVLVEILKIVKSLKNEKTYTNAFDSERPPVYDVAVDQAIASYEIAAVVK